MPREWILAVLGVAWLLVAPNAERARPQPSSHGRPPRETHVSPDLRSVAGRILQANRGRDRADGPIIALARTLDQTQGLLAATAAAAERGNGRDEAALLGAQGVQIGEILAEAKRETRDDPFGKKALAGVEPRFNRLLSEIEAIAAASEPTARARLARGTLDWLRELDPGPQAPPAPTIQWGRFHVGPEASE
jgi:hypothetical protein